MTGVAIIGCGKLGQKRAKALAGVNLVVCADVMYERAQSLAAQTPGAEATRFWEDAVQHADVNVVVVSTTNDALAKVAIAAIEAGKHVLVEKPAARSVAELDKVIEATKKAERLHVRVGFNLPYHPALDRAYNIHQFGDLGKVMYIRGSYGHGGRVGYEKEWRADPALSGGGVLIDLGVHLIDLSRWFLGDFYRVKGSTHSYFWDMPVEDNAFLQMWTTTGQVAQLHVSCTEWKNLFSLEIFGEAGKLHIEGLGGSYGVERLTHYKMSPVMGPPETIVWEYPGNDDSFLLETAQFFGDIERLGIAARTNLYRARAALGIVEEVYDDNCS